ncbi:MAG: biotin transporter BioY [Actinomycetota bacterium]|nr:biotin transporter BioY [Actinomycetota bacterium]
MGALGTAWLAVVLDLTPLRALELGVAPFVIGDLVKAAGAAVVLPVAWRFVSRAVRDPGRY